MRMVARNPVSSSTVTQELMMLNQWICRAQILMCPNSQVQAAHCTTYTGNVHHAVTLATAVVGT